MRPHSPQTRRALTRLTIVILAAATSAGLICLTPIFDNRAPALLLPHAAGPAANDAASSLAAPALSPNWTIRHHGECCEGNLAAQGDSTYLLLPVLLTGNKILRSDDGGQTYATKYPPLGASAPYGIEGDLQAFGDDAIFFGTLLAQGVAAHSDDRGENWTVVPIPVPFPANDQCWAYLGPFSDIAPVGQAQLEPYVLAGWYRIGSVALFSFDGGLTWPIQTPLVGNNGSGPSHVVCQEEAHPPIVPAPGDSRIANQDFKNQKAGRHGAWGTDRKFYWSETSNGTVGSGSSLYVCKTDNFGATWTGIQHPISPGGGLGFVVSHTAFDNNGTLYVLHGDKLYVSFNQGESFAFIHTLPRFANAGLGDSGSGQFFVVNCGTIHLGVLALGTGGPNQVYYLRGSRVDTATPAWDEELVDSVGSNRLDFFQIVLDGNGIPTMSYTKPGNEVTTASRNVPMPINGADPCAVQINPITVVSRKTHGTAGTFDVDLLSGPGIECRSGGPNGDHQVVFTFAEVVTVSAATCNGTPATTSTVGNDTTVNCTGVPNAQAITITLTGVNNGTNVDDVSVQMGVLLGDTTSNGSVNSSDIGQAKGNSGQTTAAANFRTDVTVNGAINSSDIGTIKAQSGTALP